jgi:hypothetical protein
MAELILYMGKSGTGKTTSLRNLPPEETIILTPNGKSMPFPGGNKYVRGQNLFINNNLKGGSNDAKNGLEELDIQDFIEQVANNTPAKYLIIEDFTHFFSARIFSEEFLDQNAGNAAFQRWNQFGADVFQSLFEKSQGLREDLYIIILHHTEVKEDGVVGFKSPGKLLDNTIDVPSYFTYSLHGIVRDGDGGSEYVVQTNKNASRQAKTPYGCFPDMYIPNDMKVIIDRINDFRNGKVKVVWKN